MLKKVPKNLTLLYLCFFAFSIQAQVLEDSIINDSKKDPTKKRDLFDVVESLFNFEIPEAPDTTQRKLNFSVLPLSINVPSGGKALVTTFSTTFYMGDRKSTSLSEVWFVPSFDFDGRYGIPIRSYVWLKDNKWMVRGDMRILKNPEYTWGLGKSHTEEDKLLVNKSYFRFHQHLLRQVFPGLLIGLGYNLDMHTRIRTESNEKTLSEYTNYKYGTRDGTNSISSGINFNILYDTRGNSINPSNGDYLNIEYRTNPRFMGSDQWWHSLYLDARKYYKFTSSKEKQDMIALWSYYWTTFNSNPPYFDLPSIGWDTFNTSARGFVQSRYRAKSLFYTEAEYRRNLTKDGLFGFVLFANVNSVSGPNSKIFYNWNVGGGAGLRFKVDRYSGTNISLDYAISKDNQGFYLTLGEYF